jgi:uncharacterized protein (DUF885 family)
MDQGTRAREIADTYWDDLLALEPMLGTMSGDERHDHELSDPGPAGRAASDALQRTVLADVATLDRSGLDEVLRTTLDIVDAMTHRYLAATENRTDLLAPASHWFGPANLLAEIGSLQQADTPERLDRLETRIDALPAYIGGSSSGCRLAMVLTGSRCVAVPYMQLEIIPDRPDLRCGQPLTR